MSDIQINTLKDSGKKVRKKDILSKITAYYYTPYFYDWEQRFKYRQNNRNIPSQIFGGLLWTLRTVTTNFSSYFSL